MNESLASRGISIQFTESKGRHVVATKSFKQGDLVWSEDPYVYVPGDKCLDQICHYCFKRCETKRCTACKFARYCSAQCAKNAWATDHKDECACIKKIAPRTPTETIRLMGRLLHKRTLETLEPATTKEKPTFKEIETLVSHRKEYPESKIETFAQMAVLVKDYVKEESFIGMREVVEMLCRFGCNNYNICDGELKPIGTGLYYVASMFNHSCWPNCVAVFDGKKIFMRCIRDVEQGTELTFSYIELAVTRSTRRSDLKSRYFFDCGCERCLLSSPDDNDKQKQFFRTLDQSLGAIKCSFVAETTTNTTTTTNTNTNININKQCTGAIPYDDVQQQQQQQQQTSADSSNSLACTSCGRTYPISTIKSKVDPMRKKALSYHESALEAKNDNRFPDAKANWEACLRTRQRYQYKYNVDLLNVNNELQTLCIDHGDFASARNYCNNIIELYQYIYPKCYPLLGLQYFMLGKIEWFFENTEPAYEAFMNAYTILSCTHGSSHPLVAELSSLMEQARAELYYKQQQQQQQRRLRQ